MPTSWLLSIVAIFVALAWGLIVWQRARIASANEFLGGVKVELKKVTWPGRREVINTTMVVLITVLFFGTYLSVIDYIAGTSRQSLFDAISTEGSP